MRFFVTGTDTGVGKTEVAAALLELLPGAFALKPYQSGGGDDAAELGAQVVYRFKDPVAPGVAAAREGRRSPMDRVRIPARGPLVVEGAGGLFVPLDAAHDVIDLIARLKLPVVLVARAGLGTLNHTKLSLEALKARKARVAAVVLVKSTKGFDASERDNARWLRRRNPGVRILGPVPFIPSKRKRRLALRKALEPLLSRRA
jgi:dethiobiotin synthetase